MTQDGFVDFDHHGLAGVPLARFAPYPVDPAALFESDRPVLARA